jgi:hypothetical protein
MDVIGVFHENCRKKKETTYISMARAHFESYIKFLGEPQTHRQVCRKSNEQC